MRVALPGSAERLLQHVANGNRPTGNPGNTTLLIVLIVVAVLYFARTVFIPLSLALLLTFLLAPMVIRLRHWGFGRIPSAFGVVLLAFLAMGVIGTVMVSQLADLAHKFPEYEQNVNEKLESVRSSGGGFVTRLSRVIGKVSEELTPRVPSRQGQPADDRPVPVEIRRSAFSPFDIVQKVVGSVLQIVLMAGCVIVFVIFMLIEREDLRDRLLRLAGSGRINLTTQVLDDAAHRVSRYLLAQLVINVGFGFLAGTGLYLMHIPNPLLWGMLAALLRYIPYLGIWIAAAMPAGVAFAVQPGWLTVPLVFGLYFGIDLLMYNFVEPLLYGTSTGISPLAILVAAVFWTWLWGPMGLLLATPLTVCVVVIGHHVPTLSFLRIMLSDEPVLPWHVRFYQRMLAMDLEEATELAETFLKGKSLEELYDSVIVPALSLAEQDRHRGKLHENRQQFIFDNTRILIEDIAERADQLVEVGHTGKLRAAVSRNNGRELKPVVPAEPRVVCIPARDQADELASLMLVQLLNRKGIGARALSSDLLTGEFIGEVGREQPAVACVSTVPPYGYVHARYLCRRLRSQFTQLKVVGAILTENDVEEIKQRQPPLVADELASSLRQVLTLVGSLIQLRSPASPQPAPSAS
jgi:predicted PurR-regulated permease PerM